MTRDLAIVESFVTNEGVSDEMAALEFYETNELLGQIDNWCGPNTQCLIHAGMPQSYIRTADRQRSMT